MYYKYICIIYTVYTHTYNLIINSVCISSYNYHQLFPSDKLLAVLTSSQVCLGTVDFGAFCTAEPSASGSACAARGATGDAGGALSPTRKHPSAAWLYKMAKWSFHGFMLAKQYKSIRSPMPMFIQFHPISPGLRSAEKTWLWVNLVRTQTRFELCSKTCHIFGPRSNDFLVIHPLENQHKYLKLTMNMTYPF